MTLARYDGNHVDSLESVLLAQAGPDTEEGEARRLMGMLGAKVRGGRGGVRSEQRGSGRTVGATALTLAAAVAVTAWAGVAGAAEPVQPRNVILMIGDGMGREHVQAIRAARQAAGQTLAMDEVNDAFTLMTTYSADAAITDSSSAAAAMATGYKTNNNWMSILPDGTVVPTLLEQAERMGKATGLVTTTQVAHATPAAFVSHIKDRNDFNTIALEELASGVDVLMGGGRNNFEANQRPDGRDLIGEFKALGYAYASTAAELGSVDVTKTPRILGLFHKDNGLTPMKKRPAGSAEPTLSQMTAKALAALSTNPNGFFLMVEGGQIDWESHNNNFDGMIGEGVEFDNAVRVALDFVKAHPDTLLVVTADHETGGLTYNEQDGSYSWSSKDHTAANVAVRAKGAGAQEFNLAVMDNTQIAQILADLAGYPKPLVVQSLPVQDDRPGAPVQVALKVTSFGRPVAGAEVKVDGKVVGLTNSNGQLKLDVAPVLAAAQAAAKAAQAAAEQGQAVDEAQVLPPAEDVLVVEAVKDGYEGYIGSVTVSGLDVNGAVSPAGQKAA
ncbi:MAG: alkaline phosphatase [Limnochordaceae bacterium]|nr:alkaline phosphatase [Limnochordaceae bacterium]